jgi:hypothetical protein
MFWSLRTSEGVSEWLKFISSIDPRSKHQCWIAYINIQQHQDQILLML